MMRAPSNFKLSFISLVISLLIVLAFAESHRWIRRSSENAVSWHDPNTQFDAELGWSPILGRRIETEWGTVSSNSLGFRSSEVNPKKNNILLLGDSVIWGYGMSDEKIASFYLEQKLKNTKVQIHNLGVSGYGIGQYYLYLKRKLESFDKVDQVILAIYASNDLWDTGSNVAYWRRKPLFVLEEGDLKLTNSPIRKYCLRNIMTDSLILERITMLSGRLEHWMSLLAGDRELEFEESKKIAALLIQRMRALVESKGGQLKIMLLPSYYDLDEEKSDSYLWFEAFCRDEGYSCADFGAFILESKVHQDHLYLPDDPHHYNERGNRLLAEALYKQLDLT